MENSKQMMPSVNELASYDLILFSRPRFEAEAKGRLDDLYESPLKQLHFLRIIIDEGHSFASTNTNATIVADRLVRAERRWIVSGTPAKDLMGVEVEMEALEYEGKLLLRFFFRPSGTVQDSTLSTQLSLHALDRSIALFSSCLLLTSSFSTSTSLSTLQNSTLSTQHCLCPCLIVVSSILLHVSSLVIIHNSIYSIILST